MDAEATIARDESNDLVEAMLQSMALVPPLPACSTGASSSASEAHVLTKLPSLEEDLDSTLAAFDAQPINPMDHNVSLDAP